MKMRLLQFVNNLYKDEEDTGKVPALGKYCSFGYFDALRVEETVIVQDSRKDIWKLLQENFVDQTDGKYNWRNIVCAIEDDEKDTNFWKVAEKEPFLFVSMLRVNRADSDSLLFLQETMHNINQKADAIAYYANDHCEAVVLTCGKNYSEGVKRVLELRDQHIIKIYTVFNVLEKMLRNIDKIIDEEGKEEFVNCRLATIVKNKEEIEGFTAVLHKWIQNNRYTMKVFNALGSADVIIELKHVMLSRLLKCYEMNEILTHSHEKYINAFYNIESELLPEKEWLIYGEVANNKPGKDEGTVWKVCE